jgi:hypothetical protein
MKQCDSHSQSVAAESGIMNLDSFSRDVQADFTVLAAMNFSIAVREYRIRPPSRV